MTYSQKLRDPRWQKKRLQILDRDNWTCLICKSTTKNLQVHHVTYLKADPWSYPDEHYQTLCEDCHEFRQSIIDNAANAYKLILKDLPNEGLKIRAQKIFSMAMRGGEFDQYVDGLMADSMSSKCGKISNGLFSDLMVELMLFQSGKPSSADRLSSLMDSALSEIGGDK